MKKIFILSVVLIVAGALVTYFTADSGQVHLRRYSEVSSFDREDGSEASLPFSLRLKEFRIEYYPDSSMPSDYISEVEITPPGERRTISMNHILRLKGYRFFQADYDRDLQGSVLAVSHDPWGTGIIYSGYFLLLLSLAFIFVSRLKEMHLVLPAWLKWTLRGLGAALLAGIFLFICRKLLSGHLMPVLRSPLLWIHVSSVIVSYSIFALVAVCGIWGLASKTQRDRLMKVNRAALYPAVYFLSFGIIIGSLWANISWGNYWSWDPKETWALITAVVYALVLHGESIKVLQKPVFFHVCCVIAFLFVLITYFGVNYLLGGMHAYA